MVLRSIDVVEGSTILVNGEVVPGTVTCHEGAFSPFCDSGEVTVALQSPPTEVGMHLLQIVSPDGLLSNELPICVEECD